MFRENRPRPAFDRVASIAGDIQDVVEWNINSPQSDVGRGSSNWLGTRRFATSRALTLS
jgi:hypothetical protein